MHYNLAIIWSSFAQNVHIPDQFAKILEIYAKLISHDPPGMLASMSILRKLQTLLVVHLRGSFSRQQRNKRKSDNTYVTKQKRVRLAFGDAADFLQTVAADLRLKTTADLCFCWYFNLGWS